jgi:hypothetical protein
MGVYCEQWFRKLNRECGAKEIAGHVRIKAGYYERLSSFQTLLEETVVSIVRSTAMVKSPICVRLHKMDG